MGAKATQTGDGSRDGWGYQFRVNDNAIITMQTRHDAIGLATMWRRDFGGEDTCSVEPVRHSQPDTLATLKDA